MRYATALAEWADAGGYDIEVVWDVCTHRRARRAATTGRSTATLEHAQSGGEQKRLVLEYLLRGPDEVLLLDEPDNFLDVPGKIWLEERIRESPKTILFISHDRELLDNTATRVVTVELGAPATRCGPTRAASRRTTRPARDRFARFEEMRRRWDEEHAKLKALVLRYKQKAAYNDGMAVAVPGGADPAAQVRGGRAADGAAARAAGQDAAQRRPHRQARGGVRATSS